MPIPNPYRIPVSVAAVVAVVVVGGGGGGAAGDGLERGQSAQHNKKHTHH